MPFPDPAPHCARCGKPQATAYEPFCSPGCKDRDLLDWLGERHAIPGDAAFPALDNDGADA